MSGILAMLRTVLLGDWRTVAVARRVVTFAGTIYPLHGEIDRRPVDVHYRILLQQDQRGRRRHRIECGTTAATRADLRRDPVMRSLPSWKDAGYVAPQFERVA